MTDWIEHNGGPQPVDDETWVVAPTSDMWAPEVRRAKSVPWRYATGRYRILNQHLIDAKQAEIDQLRDDLETWQSVFPHVMPDRLKSDQQLADEDLAAKIDAARLEGIRMGLEAAAKVPATLSNMCAEGSDPQRSYDYAEEVIRALNPDTIAREAVLDQLTREAQADNMGYDND